LPQRISLYIGLMLMSATIALNLPAMSDPPAQTIRPPISFPPRPKQNRSINRNFGRLPLAFERNQGQTDARVRFLTHSSDSALFLTPSEAVFTLATQPARKHNAPRADRKADRSAEKIGRVALRMQIIGANAKAAALARQPLSGKVNYFIGKDPRQWHADVPTFGKVGFQGVYPGIDLVYYGSQTHLEYDFVVAPRADPKQIQLHFAGVQDVHLDREGALVVRTAGRELKWRKPMVYQEDAAGKHTVVAHFRLKQMRSGQTGVRFALGRYDRARPLVIDPVLLYSTYLSGHQRDNIDAGPGGETPQDIAIDGSGNAYIAGYTYSTDFPTTAGAFQPTKNANSEHTTAFVTKINPTGTALVYSTYLGGTDSFGSWAAGIAIDSSGSAYITGSVYSNDFPTTPGAFQGAMHIPGANYSNAFVTKLNATGSALIYSTYLGGSGGTPGSGDAATKIAIDAGGSAYVAGYAQSKNFPTTPGAFQKVNRSGSPQSATGFVTKLNATGTALIYSTYLGGGNTDFLHDLAVDSSGSAYVTGGAYSTDFPTTPGAFQRVNKAATGFDNAFVTRIDPTGSTLLYSTYLGGSISDAAEGIAIDSSGNAYVAGTTNSPDFPTTPGAFQRLYRGSTSIGSVATGNGFVTKLNAAGTALVYSTYLGDIGDGAGKIAIDRNGNACVVGQAHSPDFPTTPGAFQRVNRSQTGNGFIARLNATGTALLYSTYLGGSFNGFGIDSSYGDSAVGIALDNNGNAYVLGLTYSADFPITPGAFQPTTRAAAHLTNATVTKLSIVPTFPDFNNDGHTDLILQNPTTGEIGSWYQHGPRQNGGALFSLTPPTDFALVGVGDFSANGANTLVLQSRTTNKIALWYTGGTNGTTISGGVFVSQTPAVGWKIVGVGDFNADGKSDLVFQHQTSGQIAIWFMDGSLYAGGVLLPSAPAAGWQVVGVGDLHADGFSGLVFQNQTSGQIAFWTMHGTTLTGSAILPNVPGSGWKVVGVGDYSGDGSADLVFQNQTTNQGMIWFLGSGALVGSAPLSIVPPSGWKIVGPR